MMINKRLILASKSPRRYALLKPYFENVQVEVNSVEEKYSSSLPHQIVCELAKLKLGDLPQKFFNDLVVSGDTIVWFDGKALGKPKDEEDAFVMLKSLSGKSHQVYSGFAVSYKGKIVVDFDVCDIVFKNLTDKQIVDYIKSGSPMDKAGGYGVQDGIVVQSYEGDLNTIIGLPLDKILKVCEDFLKNG